MRIKLVETKNGEIYPQIICEQDVQSDLKESISDLNFAIRTLHYSLIDFWEAKIKVDSELSIFVSVLTENHRYYSEGQKLIRIDKNFIRDLTQKGERGTIVDPLELFIHQSKLDTLGERALKTIITEVNSQINDSESIKSLGKKMKAILYLKVFQNDSKAALFQKMRNYIEVDKTLVRYFNRPIVKVFTSIVNLSKIRLFLIGNPVTFLLTELIVLTSEKFIDFLFGELDEEKTLKNVRNELSEVLNVTSLSIDFSNKVLNSIISPFIDKLQEIDKDIRTSRSLGIGIVENEELIRSFSSILRNRIQDVNDLAFKYKGQNKDSKSIASVVELIEKYFNEYNDWSIKLIRKEKIRTSILDYIFMSNFTDNFDKNILKNLQNSIALYLLFNVANKDSGRLYKINVSAFDEESKLYNNKSPFTSFFKRDVQQLINYFLHISNQEKVKSLSDLYSLITIPNGIKHINNPLYTERYNLEIIRNQFNLTTSGNLQRIIPYSFFEIIFEYSETKDSKNIEVYIDSQYYYKKSVSNFLESLLPNIYVDENSINKIILNGEFTITTSDASLVRSVFNRSIGQFIIPSISSSTKFFKLGENDFHHRESKRSSFVKIQKQLLNKTLMDFETYTIVLGMKFENNNYLRPDFDVKVKISGVANKIKFLSPSKVDSLKKYLFELD